MNENITIEKTRKYYKLFPFIKSGWDKENNIKKGTCPKLDEKFYVKEYFKGFVNKKDILKFYNRREKAFYIPIGINFEMVKKILFEHNIYYKLIENDEILESRYVEFDIDEKFKPRDEIQEKSIKFLTSKSIFHSRILALATGKGKTFCAIKSIQLLNTSALIISETLSDQWIERIIQYTNHSCTIENKRIKLITGTDNLHRLLSIEKQKAIFYITTSSTLDRYLDRYGEDSLNEICLHIGVGIACFDEFHMHWAQNVRIDRCLNTEYTWFLTATPDRTNTQESKLFHMITETIPVFGLNTFKIDTHINLRLITYDSNASEIDIQKCMTYKGLSSVLYWNYLFETFHNIIYIMGMIRMIIDPFIRKNKDSKILIYLVKLDHVDRFIEMLEMVYDKDVKIGNYTTKIDKKHKRYEIRKNIIFTTIGSGGVGLDISNLVAILSLVPYSSSITSIQMIGRLRNNNINEIYFYDFIDSSFETMLKQREKRLQIFTQKSKSIKKTTITREQVDKYLEDN